VASVVAKKVPFFRARACLQRLAARVGVQVHDGGLHAQRRQLALGALRVRAVRLADDLRRDAMIDAPPTPS
jgi:hypothetical protein